MITSRKVFIQQPYFLPWLGYFSKIYRSDIFFILDKAPFRRNYLNRTMIFEPNGKRFFLTCPTGASQGVPLSNISIPHDFRYLDKFLKTIAHSYSKANYFVEEMPIIKRVFDKYRNTEKRTLSNVNIEVILMLMDYFQIDNSQIDLESNHILPINKNYKTIKILNSVNGKYLICGDGGSTKIHDIKLFEDNGISIELIPYYSKHPKYKQIHSNKRNEDFTPGLSFIDALLNIGKDKTIELIKKDVNEG